jgi:hypothetical protein
MTCDVQVNFGQSGYGLPASFSTDDLSFGSPLPAARELSAAERYMLAGTLGSNLPDQRPLAPWISEVEDFCLDYAERYPELPEIISPEALALAGPGEKAEEDTRKATLLLSPVTGRAPRLSSASFSPGDLYVRPLSRAEMLKYASMDSELRESWFGDPTAGNCRELCSPVLYVRAWGERSVIYENLVWRSREIAPEIGEVISLLQPQRRYTSGAEESDSTLRHEETPLPPPPTKNCRTGSG